jgi:outer membrane protein OmpA-like peptidoglycan-associated protein
MHEENAPDENHPAAEPQAQESSVAAPATKPAIPPVVILALVVCLLLGMIIVMVWRGKPAAPAASEADVTELQAEINARRGQLNRERMALGLQPLEGGTEPVEDIAKRLKKDADTMVALVGSLQAMLAEKETDLTARKAELLSAEQRYRDLAAASQRQQTDLQRALVESSGADVLRSDLATMKSQRDALAAELITVKQELAAKGQGASQDEFADLKRRYDETLRAKDFFEAKVKELGGQLTNVKAKLFASTENELLPAAVELIRSLRKLENLSEAEISAAYSSLGVQLGSNVLQKFSFATGSSALAPADQETIRNLVADIPDGDLLLAIGYASETGNVDKNRTLSSDRATAVAELFSSVKRPEQLVQAVYLGQTNRFSKKPPEANQVVEIWRIRKK